tara:strand:+ start:5286 stop:5957 length:672 start_codon:yes stop_codon:yes gene_type:complete
MHRQISKKIIIYLFIFIFLTTLFNNNLSKTNFLFIDSFEITGLNDSEKKQIIQNLDILKNKNLFFLNKEEILEKLNSYKSIERFFISKIYPSKLKIDIQKTNYLAITKKNDLYFYLGSNGKLIEANEKKENLPFVYGDFDVEEFLKLKKIIDNSKFNFDEIKSLYFFKSRRWDLKTIDGITIKLPLEIQKKSIEIILKLLNDNNFKDIKVIDLRQDNQVILNG